MAEHDLTARMAGQMDCHLVFPLLEFLQERALYANKEILEAKLRLLSGTNMVDYAMDIHKSLHDTDEVPDDMVRRRTDVVSRLRALDEATAPIVSFLQNQQLVQELRPDKQYNLHMLQDRFQVDLLLPPPLPRSLDLFFVAASLCVMLGLFSLCRNVFVICRWRCDVVRLV
jgi:translation initiation factor 3 subunit E